jgi:L-threonylcarbamoyladenylate synthase
VSSTTKVDGRAPDAEMVQQVVAHLVGGGILAYPTETVYGLGGRVEADVIRRLQALKGRGAQQPFLLLIGSASSVQLEWTHEATVLSRRFWPGPLTLVLSDALRHFPPGVRGANGGVAVRVSPHPFVVCLMQAWDRPLLSTSANRPGEAPAVDVAGVESVLAGKDDSGPFLIADGGRLSRSPPSSVVDCTRTPPALLREGALSFEALRGVVPGLQFPARA